MSGGEGDGFIEEEKFGVAVGFHELAVPVFVDEVADDPELPAPGGFDELFLVVVEASAVAHEESAGGDCFDLGGGGDSVLEGHGLG